MGISVEEITDLVSKNPEVYKNKDDIKTVVKMLKSIDVDKDTMIDLFKNIDEDEINACWEETSVDSDCTDEYNRAVERHNISILMKYERTIKKVVPDADLSMIKYISNRDCHTFYLNERKCQICGLNHREPSGMVLIHKATGGVYYVCKEGCGLIPYDGATHKLPPGKFIEMKIQVNNGNNNGNNITNYNNYGAVKETDKLDKINYEMRGEKITLFDKKINELIAETFKMREDKYLEFVKNMILINKIKFNNYDNKWYKIKKHFYSELDDIEGFYTKILSDKYDKLTNYYYETVKNIRKCQFIENIIKDLMKDNVREKIINSLKKCKKIRIDDQINGNYSLLSFKNGVFDIDANKFRDVKNSDYVSSICVDKIDEKLTDKDIGKFKKFFNLFSNGEAEFMNIIRTLKIVLTKKNNGHVIIHTGKNEIDYKFTDVIVRCFSGYIRYHDERIVFGERVSIVDYHSKLKLDKNLNNIVLATSCDKINSSFMKNTKITIVLRNNKDKDEEDILKFVGKNENKLALFIMNNFRKCDADKYDSIKTNKTCSADDEQIKVLKKFSKECFIKVKDDDKFVTQPSTGILYERWCKTNKIDDKLILGVRRFCECIKTITFNDGLKFKKIAGKTYRIWRGFKLSSSAETMLDDIKKEKLKHNKDDSSYTESDEEDVTDDDDDTNDTDN